MQKRNIILGTILNFVTCGLYGLYWISQITDEVQRATGRKATATGGMAALYTFLSCSLYFFYWIYKTSGEVGELREARGLASDGVSKESYVLSGIAVAVISIILSGLYVTLAALLIASGAMDGSMAQEEISETASGAGQSIIGIIVTIIVLGVYLLIVMRRKEGESPRLLYVITSILLMKTVFMPTLALGFLQKSLNDLATD